MTRRMFQRLLGACVLLVPVFTAGCFGQATPDDGDIDLISLDRLTQLYAKQQSEPESRRLLLLDARSAQAYSAGHIAGAEHMQLSDIDPDLGRDPRIEAYKNIVVYADNPGSATSPAVTKRLLRLRYDDVYMFAGGFDAWVEAGLPTE